MFGLYFGGGTMSEIMPAAIIASGVMLAAIVGLVLATGVTNVITRPRNADYDALRAQLREHLATLREQQNDTAGIRSLAA